MPVEIKELIIRTNIISEDSMVQSSDLNLSKSQMRSIIDDCVNQVIKKIERKNER